MFLFFRYFLYLSISNSHQSSQGLMRTIINQPVVHDFSPRNCGGRASGIQALRFGRRWVRTTRTRVGRVRHDGWALALAFQLAKSEMNCNWFPWIPMVDGQVSLEFWPPICLNLLLCRILGYPQVIAPSISNGFVWWLKGTTILQRVWILIDWFGNITLLYHEEESTLEHVWRRIRI